MGEPWGPPKRRLTKLDEWVGAWPTDIANHYIHADWYGPSPIYTQDNFVVVTGHVGPGGALSTEMVEASAADIAEDAKYIGNHSMTSLPPRFGPGDTSPSGADSLAWYKRYFSVPLTEAGGAIAATVIVPALAGYTSHCEVQGVWAPAGTTDPANTWTFIVTAGTILGADVLAMNLTASRYHNFSAGVAGVYGPSMKLRGDAAAAADDNKTITVQA
ncbi:unnamed protein product, partial [marine sediment metagenome]